MVKIGIISDTHGFLSEAASDALRGSSRIVHAGDIGGTEILKTLSYLAPVTAVRGNMDGGSWANALPHNDTLAIEGIHLFVLHDILRLDLDPAAAGFGAVISGHTHQASITRKNGVWLINPGSASQPRYGAQSSIATLEIVSGRMNARIVSFDGSNR